MTKVKLNPNSQKWVDALRSGKYQQIHGALRDKVGFCCLGVGCDISGLGIWDEDGCYKVGDEVRGGELPEAVANWLGIMTHCGIIGSLETSLDIENDAGKTFPQIADLIEQYAEELGVAAR